MSTSVVSLSTGELEYLAVELQYLTGESEYLESELKFFKHVNFITWQVSLSTVKSGNSVTFFAQNTFFHKISWRYPIFFSGSKFIKKVV